MRRKKVISSKANRMKLKMEKPEKAVQIVKTMLQVRGKEVFVVKRIPDLILIDFDKKEVCAVEVSSVNQKNCKSRGYDKSDFKKILLFKFNRHLPIEEKNMKFVCTLDMEK